MPAQLQDELREFRRRLGALSGFVLPAEANPHVAMDRDQLDKWFRLADEKAALPKLRHALWHLYRRKWATERKHRSLKDVAAGGGWKRTPTLLEQPDPETILKVMSEPRKLRDVVAQSGA